MYTKLGGSRRNEGEERGFAYYTDRGWPWPLFFALLSDSRVARRQCSPTPAANPASNFGEGPLVPFANARGKNDWGFPAEFKQILSIANRETNFCSFVPEIKPWRFSLTRSLESDAILPRRSRCSTRFRFSNRIHFFLVAGNEARSLGYFLAKIRRWYFGWKKSMVMVTIFNTGVGI